MKVAMILAAGRGQRMRPLTDQLPKPLLPVNGRPLIEYVIARLVAAGYQELVINHAHLGALIEARLGDGARFGARIRYSPEQPALDTGGGIRRALPLLGPGPFLVVNGDLWCDFDYACLTLAPTDLAQLVLVDNPPHHPHGDFVLRDGRVGATGAPRLTFAGIGLYRPELFAACPPDAFALAPLLCAAMEQNRVGGVHHRGEWRDIGTPERLHALQAALAASAARG